MYHSEKTPAGGTFHIKQAHQYSNEQKNNYYDAGRKYM